jgi:hypothetical protein
VTVLEEEKDDKKSTADNIVIAIIVIAAVISYRLAKASICLKHEYAPYAYSNKNSHTHMSNCSQRIAERQYIIYCLVLLSP